jgi:hypothetical protein
MLSLAVYQPKQALKQLVSQSKNFLSQSQLVEQLTHEDLEILRKAPVIQEVIQSARETADADYIHSAAC